MKHKDMKKDEHACIDNLQALFEIGRKLNIEQAYRAAISHEENYNHCL